VAQTENIISRPKPFTLMGEHSVRCTGCGDLLPPCSLRCSKDDGLPRAEYIQRRIVPRDLPGIWRFIDWLPVREPLKGTGGGAVSYKSSGLARELGLENLLISFSGYWPEIGATLRGCSFKDLEAAPTMRRLVENGGGIMVVASAGNTARSFAQVANAANLPLVLVVPKESLHRLWAIDGEGPICLVAVEGDYNQAIVLGESISSEEGFQAEGGARNIARRDGMGTVMLEAVLRAGKLPHHYFQAVGSGTGGIAAWEASMRLLADGRFGERLPRLHLAQNLPCAPIHSAWMDLEGPKSTCPRGMYDDVLFNRHPPYAIPGGVAEALQSTNGAVYGVGNEEAKAAEVLFQEAEGIDILPAAAVAVAALIQARRAGRIGDRDHVLLNITGGGISRLKEDFTMNYITNDMTVHHGDSAEAVVAKIREILRGRGICC